MRLHHEGSMIRVQCQLMICRGHIRASKGAFKISLCVVAVSILPEVSEFRARVLGCSGNRFRHIPHSLGMGTSTGFR